MNNLQQLIRDILIERDTRCKWKSVSLDEEAISKKYGYCDKNSDYDKLGCINCDGYKLNCEYYKQ